MVGDIEHVLQALNDAQVRYVIAGGVAVVLHGHLRTTADLDLALRLDTENVLRAVRALSELGYRPRAPVSAESFADEETRSRWVREQGLTVFSLWSSRFPTLELDLFAVLPFNFEDVYSRALRVPLERTEAVVMALDDLIALKRQAGRPVDQEDIRALEALRDASDRGGEHA
ncbi:MAG: nucleotidyltransferase [Acidobacteriia bacterium]|nr:nucleotidyltransferase [Terriglobia bacterium]